MGHTKLASSAMDREARARREHNTVSRVIVSACIFAIYLAHLLNVRHGQVVVSLVTCYVPTIVRTNHSLVSLVTSRATFGSLPAFSEVMSEVLILSDM